MKAKFLRLSALGGVAASLLVAGCTRTTVIIIAVPPRPIMPAFEIPCRLQPIDPHIYGPTGAANPIMLPTTPPTAVAAHVAGCAGVAFQLSPDGRPVNAFVVREWPAGYGFGVAALAALSGNVFHPPKIDNGWHYAVSGMRPPGPVVGPLAH